MNGVFPITQAPLSFLSKFYHQNFEYLNAVLVRQVYQQELYLRILRNSRPTTYQLWFDPSYSSALLDNDCEMALKNESWSLKNINTSYLAGINTISGTIESGPSGSTETYQKGFNLKEIKDIKIQILDMLNYFMESFGKSTMKEIETQRSKYAQNIYLAETFDTLLRKYSETTKCREDMVRFLLRKALTFMRNSLGKELKLNAKQASLALCKRYFMGNSELELESMRDEVLDFFLPYKKNSRNKTPNARFIEEAFQSKDFQQDYTKYISKFDEIMKTDNQKRIKKFIELIYDCIIKKKIHKIKEYKRLPWTSSWIETMKIIAEELPNNLPKKGIKRTKE